MSAKLVYQKSGLFRNLGEKLRERAQTQSVREQTKGDLIGVATNKTKSQAEIYQLVSLCLLFRVQESLVL